MDVYNQSGSFIDLIRKEVALKKPIPLIHPPRDITSIAVHIRKGGGFDHPLLSEQHFQVNDSKRTKIPKNVGRNHADYNHSMKFPPEQYYVDQIKKISQLLDHQELYLFIFTDETNTELLIERISSAVGLDNISYDYRKENNSHSKNVLRDFFSIANFDCFIRSKESAFAQTAHLLGDFMIAIYPESFHWEQEDERYYLIMEDIQVCCSK